MAVVLVLIKVIRAHDGPCPTLLDGSLEGREIDLMQGAVADDDVHLMPVFLIVVQGIVLHTGSNALRLKTLDVRHHHSGGEPGVFTHILKVAAIKRCAVDVHTRAQYDMLTTVECLFCQTLTIETGERRIPSGCQTGQRRECDTGVIGLTSLHPLIPQHIRTHAMRSVVGPEVRESQSFDTRTGEFRLCMDDSDLLIECHPCQGIIDTLFNRLRLIEIDRRLCEAHR